MSGLAGEGFVLGLSMGGSCAAVCGPFLAPYLVAEGGLVSVARRVGVFAEFLIGRLAAYLAVALLAAWTGRTLGAVFSPRMQGAMLAAAAAVLIWFSFRAITGRPRKFRGLRCIVSARGYTLASGFLLGLNLCPPFAVAFARAMGLEDAGRAAIFFLFLFLGTTVCLLPLPFIAAFMRTEGWRRAGGYFGLIAGAWFAVQGMAQCF